MPQQQSVLQQENYRKAIDALFVEIETFLMNKDLRAIDYYQPWDRTRFKSLRANPTLKRIAAIAALMNKRLTIKLED